MHSFHAFIDESGDDGFVFKDPPERASSEWFVSSAVVVRDSLLVPVSNDINNTIVDFEKKRGSVVHFTRLQHDQRKYVAQALGGLRIRVIHVCINKKRIPLGHGMAQDRRLHHYSIRLLLERISWLCRDAHKKQSTGDGRCKLNFSRCKNLSYENVSSYLATLKQRETNIEWASLDSESFNVKQHAESIWLRLADIAASGIAKGLELGEHGLCEDAYARLMRPVAYSYNGRCMSYGLKFLGPPPAVEVERDNRYSWLSLYT